VSKISRKLILLLVLGTFAFVIVHAQNDTDPDTPPTPPFYNYIEEEKLASSRFTREDDKRELDPAHFVPITEDDGLVHENERFRLYLNEKTLNFKTEDKRTGYVWSTAMEDSDAGRYDGLLKSGIGIEYINIPQNMALRENVGLIDIEHELTFHTLDDGIAVDVEIGGYCATRACENLYEGYLEGEHTLEEMEAAGYTQIDLDFRLEVRLTDDGIHAHIPYESIVERGTDRVVFSSIILFPALGATEMDHVPGYMLIPDGVGALIRYEDKQGMYRSPYEERFYGGNIGIRTGRASVANYPLSMPVFGAVHGVDQNAFLGIIESGDLSARLLAFPNGARNTPYNLIFPKFDFKQVYRQPFTSDGAASAPRWAEVARSDISVRYNFLVEEEANYPGMARHYQEHLLDSQALSPLEKDQGDIPIHIQYLMSDSRSRFIGESLLEMTSVKDVRRIHEELARAGIVNQHTSLMGWNKGGYSGHLPAPVAFERNLGSRNEFLELLEELGQDQPVMLLNNYIRASQNTPNVSYRRDVARGVNRFKLETACDACVHGDIHYLYPEKSRDRAFRHLEDYQKIAADLLFESMGSMLYSYYDGDVRTREDALAHYLEIMDIYHGTGQFMFPNAYAYPYTEHFYQAPIYNSQLKYFDDLVPFLSIVLRGHMELFSPFMNFNGLGREQLLMLVDFGINPAYVLSEERAGELRGSDIEHFYTTSHKMWGERIAEEYHFVNEALRHVAGEAITDRRVLAMGIVRVTYENGVEITINYTSRTFTLDEMEIEPLHYHIGGEDA